MSANILSFIIPAYNEEERISSTLYPLLERYPNSEFLIIIDGCIDNTENIIDGLSIKHTNIKKIKFEHRLGKGGAIIEGLKRVKKDYAVIIDADGSVFIPNILSLLNKYEKYDVIIGSRYLPNSIISKKQPFIRIILSRFFNKIVHLMFPDLKELTDTQCGFKIIKTSMIRKILLNLIISGFSFDVNLLLSVIEASGTIIEVPIIWNHSEGGTVGPNLLKVSLKMFYSLVLLKKISLINIIKK